MSRTWTPVLTINNSSDGITYTSQSGTYIRIGSKIECTFFINLSSKGTNSGVVKLTGLPMTAKGLLGPQFPISAMGAVTLNTGYVSTTLAVNVGTTTANINQVSNNGGGYDNLKNTNLTNLSLLYGTFSYEV
jgi:hypothetical protein